MKYSQTNHIPNSYIEKKITEFLIEDMPNGDITSLSTIPLKTNIQAEIHAVEKLIFVGKNIIPLCFGQDCEVKIKLEDGDQLVKDHVIGIVKGPAQIILSRERVMLNLIQRMCGIATLAKDYSNIAKPYNIKILDTRKTTPGLRLFEKYAVAIGGAFNHRMNLSEGILIKDNHIVAAGSVSKAIKFAQETNLGLPIELEIDNLNQIKEALKIGVDGFLLDNMNLKNINAAVSMIRKSKNGKNIFIEASGGITLDNIKPYLNTGVNAISIGALTHKAISKDIRLEFIS